MKEKYLWYTDTHLDKVLPWTKFSFLRHINKEQPKGIFLTGDISNGLMTCFDLSLLAATHSKCPIYFVLGNHDYHFSSFEKTHDKIKKLCEKHSNLIWMTDSAVVHLSDEVALIGTEGWYDASIGNPEYLKATTDWMLIDDFRKLPSLKERIQLFQHLADKSCSFISEKLEQALDQGYKTIYILTHFPPWKEATRDVGTVLEKFWLPYNVNSRLGQTIEDVMKIHKKKNVTVLAGHTHHPEFIRISRNVNCQIGKHKLFAINSQIVYI